MPCRHENLLDERNDCAQSMGSTHIHANAFHEPLPLLPGGSGGGVGPNHHSVHNSSNHVPPVSNSVVIVMIGHGVVH